MNCLITGNDDLEQLRGYEEHYLVRSKSSGFVFCDRIPSEAELITHYSKYKRDYSLPESTLSNYKKLLEKEFEPFRKNNRILDIGCGDGHFLEVAKSLGWEVFGTEYVDDVVGICVEKGITMHKGKLDPDNYHPDYFDVITSFEVMEHINNPIEEVSNVNKILRFKGAFYITTPNFNALERYLLKADYNDVITYPDHLCYYTPKTMDLLLSKCGFYKSIMETTGVRPSNIKKAINRRSQVGMANSSQDDKLRKLSNSNGFFQLGKDLLNIFLRLFGVGNALKCLYLKSEKND